MTSRPFVKILGSFLFLLVGTSLWGCGRDFETIQASDPLIRIEFGPSGGFLQRELPEAYLHAQPGVNLQELVPLQPFLENGLWPGMTVQDATSVLGQPDYTTTDYGGRDDVFGFKITRGTVEVVMQHVSSEGAEVDRWFLRYRPENCNSVVHPLVLQQLRALDRFPDAATVFADRDDSGVAKIEFTPERNCSRIWWLQRGETELEPG